MVFLDLGGAGSASFLPRVTVGRLVLARAEWSLDGPELKQLKALGKRGGAAAFNGVQEWRARRGLPRFVSLADDDNELPFDLDRALSVETLLDLLSSRGSAALVEFFPGPDDLAASGPEGRFVHELVVPLVRVAPAAKAADPDPTLRLNEPPAAQWSSAGPETAAAPETASAQTTLPAREVRRCFSPGSEWLYLKLYCGTAMADQALLQLVHPGSAELLSSGAIDRWFFIRYADPEPHLRVRLHGDPRRLLGEAIPLVERAAAALLADGRIRRWQIETYEREIERYGGPAGIELAEAIFHVDSETALALIEACPGDAGLDARWRLALAGIDRLLDDFGFSLETKLRIMREFRDGLAAEFRADAGLVSQLAQKFRGERKPLEELLARPDSPDHPLAIGLAMLDGRSQALAPWLAALAATEDRGALSRPREELAPAFIHMFVNRLLRAAHRAQELVIYDFLTRLYQSQAARARSAPGRNLRRKIGRVGRPVLRNAPM